MQADLQSFLKTAELLQIKGLTETVSWGAGEDGEGEEGREDSRESADLGTVSPTINTITKPGQKSAKRRRLSSELSDKIPKLLNDSVVSHQSSKTTDDEMEIKDEINDLEEESNLYVDESADAEGELLLSSGAGQEAGQQQVQHGQGLPIGPNHKKCTECGIMMLKKNFARHMRDMHTTPKPRSLCPLCQKSYKTSDWLKDHIRRGHGYTKELTDKLMSSMKGSETVTTIQPAKQSHELGIKQESLENETNHKTGKPGLALIDIQSQPMTILNSQSIVKQLQNISQ